MVVVPANGWPLVFIREGDSVSTRPINLPAEFAECLLRKTKQITPAGGSCRMLLNITSTSFFFCRLLNSLDSVLSLPSFLFTLSQLRFDSEATNLQQNYNHLDTRLLSSLFFILSMLMIMASGGRSSR